MKKLIYLFVAVALAACGGPAEKSETLKQAEKVHESIISISGDLADMMHSKVDMLEEKIEAAAASGDSLMAVQLGELNTKLDDLHNRFHEWEENMVEIPGHAHSHDHGDHDHHHDHDHVQENIMEGLSDQEHLDIQQEQLDQLNALKQELESIEI